MRHFYCFIFTLLFFLTACTPSHTLTLTRQPDAVAWTRPLNDLPLRQTFRVPNEGLSEIELLLALPAGAPVLASRPLDWQILRNDGTVLREGTLDTAGYLSNTPLRLQFEPLRDQQQVELALTGPSDAQMRLWRSRDDYYADGKLLYNATTSRNVDLYFTLRVEERATDLFAALRGSEGAATRWQDVGEWRPSWPTVLERSWWMPSLPISFEWLWIPLLLIAPGWLLGWLLGAPLPNPRLSPPLTPPNSRGGTANSPSPSIGRGGRGVRASGGGTPNSPSPSIGRGGRGVRASGGGTPNSPSPSIGRGGWGVRASGGETPNSPSPSIGRGGWGVRAALPMAPAAAGLSLALMPILYLWSMLIGLRLYEQFVSSIFYILAVLLLLLIVHDPKRTVAAWRTHWRNALGVLGLFILAGIATWLLAGRALLAPPSALSVDSGLLVQELLANGSLKSLSAPFPPAALSFTLARMSRQPVPLMLLLSGLILGVATIPSIYALAAEITKKPWVALWLLPLAWIWPTPWQALADGDLLALYSLVLLPITVALGLRALGTTSRVWHTLLLAAFPLAALFLVQGGVSIGAWAITLAVETYKRAQTPQTRKDDLTVERLISSPRRAISWLMLAALLLLPAGVKGASLTPQLPLNMMGYDWLLLIISFALLAEWLGRRMNRRLHLITALVLLSLPLLLWWRSTPIESHEIVLTQNESDALRWASMGTNPDALFLINLTVDGEKIEPIDSGFWMPFYGEPETVLQRDISPDLLAQAMQLERLNDPQFRQSLQDAGVTHIYLNAFTAGPLHPKELTNQTWANLIHQSGPIYIFELISTPPEPVGKVETREHW